MIDHEQVRVYREPVQVIRYRVQVDQEPARIIRQPVVFEEQAYYIEADERYYRTSIGSVIGMNWTMTTIEMLLAKASPAF